MDAIGPDLLAAAAALHDDTIELRRAIHREPELGLDLPETQRKITDALTGLGLDITLGGACTSVVLDTTHTGLVFSRPVAEHVCRFLRHGHFEIPAASD